MSETQHSIEKWRAETFGKVGTLRIAARANEEMAELLTALSKADHAQAIDECADVLIVLYGVASALGISLHDAVDVKMLVNRTRTWRVDESGAGYHVKPETKP